MRLVVLGVNGVNDLHDERAFAHFVESGMSPKAWAYQQAGRLFPGKTFGFVQLWKTWIVKHGDRRIRSPGSPPEDLDPVTVCTTSPPTVVGYDPDHQSPAWDCATRDLRVYPEARRIAAAIARLAELCASQQRRAAVSYFPLKQTIHPPCPDDQDAWVEFLRWALPWVQPERWPREQVVAAGRTLLRGDLQLESRIAGVCDSLGIAFHTLRPALDRAAVETSSLQYYHFDMHWNTSGNVTVGREAIRWIRNVWPDDLRG